MPSRKALEDNLRRGIARLGLDPSDAQIDRLLDYVELLEKWNSHYNLTAIRDPAKMISYHLLDSLSIHGLLRDARLALDVGSGAGLPGIPLAIISPGLAWILLDSNSKKTRFIRQAIAHCNIDNARVVHARIEDYDVAESPDFIVSRAYASLAEFCAGVAHLMKSGTCLVAMKSDLGEHELNAIDRSRFELETVAMIVPGITEKRNQVILRPL